jgi:hypothetical protein
MDFFPNGIALVSLVALAAQGLRVLVEQQREIADRRHKATLEWWRLQAAVLTAPHQPQFPALTHGTWHGTAPQGPQAAAAAPVVTEAPTPALPGVVTLDTLLAQGWRPRPDRLLLGLGPDGARYEVPADDKLCHVLTVGRTGYGKSSFNRLLLPQLIACGYDVYLLDVDYTPVDPKNGEEWWPIAQRTAPGAALFELDDIRAAIEDAAAEVDRRHVLRRQARDAGAPVPWTPRFYAIEEAPELTSRYPELMDKLAHVLRRGRRVDVFALLIAQSALIKVIGGNSGDRGQFGTVAYMGGEPTSARAILGPGPEPGGRGLARLRCYGVPTAVDARIPYGTNSGIRALLGTDARPTTVATNQATTPATIIDSTATTVATTGGRVVANPDAATTPTSSPVSQDAERALALFIEHKSMAKVVQILDGITSSQGRIYQEAVTRRSADVAAAMAARLGHS